MEKDQLPPPTEAERRQALERAEACGPGAQRVSWEQSPLGEWQFAIILGPAADKARWSACLSEIEDDILAGTNAHTWVLGPPPAND